ncbi:MAG TPA: hypothetical protein G4O14_09715 [Anaerolineae bacterium]|nr:hypothetical protein [Anaerolineae bacterium]
MTNKVVMDMEQRGRSGGSIRVLETVLLFFLDSSSCHGYGFLGPLNEFGLGDRNPSGVYQTIREMDEQGWVRSR